MKEFLANLLLALTWAAMTGEVTEGSIFTGFLLGYVILYFVQDLLGLSLKTLKIRPLAELVAYFLRDLVAANLRVAYDVVTPEHRMRPGVIALPLDARTDEEITLLANLISLTPGTLVLDVSPDRKRLYIHVMYLDEPDALRREIKEGLERRLLKVMR
ncbi:MAG: Na+/H+ antiporter subunit E [Deltaproteobacteria bacterium]|nr:Na+/H+ antiporter subunit E [Deltaproteobacteria bacterium]